jgi:hypothetical protein
MSKTDGSEPSEQKGFMNSPENRTSGFRCFECTEPSLYASPVTEKSTKWSSMVTVLLLKKEWHKPRLKVRSSAGQLKLTSLKYLNLEAKAYPFDELLSP